MKRSGSSLPQFVQRIPADVRPLMADRTLTVPLGSDTIRVRFTPPMRSVRFSLRTRDPAEARIRQGQAAAAFERHGMALRKAAPATRTHKQGTALASDLYRAWADAGADRTVAVQHTPEGWVRVRSTPEEEGRGFASALANLEAATQSGDSAERLLERTTAPTATCPTATWQTQFRHVGRSTWMFKETRFFSHLYRRAIEVTRLGVPREGSS
ncbi:hypothetical protein [Methylobacterium sp. ID0610]|uniref:hypothetical protein n=1 Tax=Methylobacterium carpenticola TaxID=3344827 RepID=UPI0036B005A3